MASYARAFRMLESLGYELLMPETAKDLHAIKDGKLRCRLRLDLGPVAEQANHLTRLHRAIMAANAAGGFYVTTRDFRATPKPTRKPPRSSWLTARCS